MQHSQGPAAAEPFEVSATSVHWTTIRRDDSACSIRVTFILTNPSPIAVPARSYAVQFHIDQNMPAFDYAAPAIMPSDKASYEFESTIRSGEHKYRVITYQTGSSMPSTNITEGTMKLE
jgi:hypothetical protein